LLIGDICSTLTNGAAATGQRRCTAAVMVVNVSAADPLGRLGLYGEHVLPELRS
jgi:hypothetical protein